MKKESSVFLQNIKDDPDRGMFCLDWKDSDPFELLGALRDDDFIRFDIVLNPCNYLHTMLDY